MTEPINLIEKALQYAKEARYEFETSESVLGLPEFYETNFSESDFESNIGVISEPLYPKARREVLYLRIREYISVGCRRAVKLLDKPYKRSIAYSVLMQACIDIFHYKKTDNILAVYNGLLDDMIGTH